MDGDRWNRRFIMKLPLWVRFREQEGQTALDCEAEEEQTTTTSISAGSCFFYVNKMPALGALAVMRVAVPLRNSASSGQVICTGKVVWVSDRKVKGRSGVVCTIDSCRINAPEAAETTAE